MMKTATGFEYEINKEMFNNMELLDAFADLQESDNDVAAISKVIRLLLGNEAKKRLYDHVRTEDGRVPVDKVMEEMTYIFTHSDDLKK